MKKIIPIILLSFSVLCLNAQANVDALLSTWKNNTQVDSIRVSAFYNYIKQEFLYSNPDTAFILANELIDFAKEKDNLIAQYYGLSLQGDSWYERGVYTKAIDCYQRCTDLCKQINYPKGIGNSLHYLGNIYYYQKNYDKALEYWTSCLAIREQIGDKGAIAYTAGAIGLIYQKKGDYAKAIEQFTLGLRSSEAAKDPYGTSVFLHNIGDVYHEMKDYNSALEYMSQSLIIAEENELDKVRTTDYVDMGRIYQDQNDYAQAIISCQKSYDLCVSLGDLLNQKEACDCLYLAFKASGEIENALIYHELFNSIEDSLQTTATSKKLQEMEFQKQVFADSMITAEKERLVQAAHEEEVRHKNRIRNYFAGAGLLAILFAIGFYSRWRYVHKSKAILQTEKDRSENLLLNILPEEIAAELKEKGKAAARDFDKVSILFSDFKGFTEASAKLNAQDLVSEINACFVAFDGIMGKYKIEKIKTIGDAYMAAGGLPVPSDDSVKNTVLAALEMQVFIGKRKVAMDAKGQPAFEMRVGIHTGPVVAGIVGVKKFQYDIWGDTVNTASRMESNGHIGKVNISQATFDLLKDEPEFVFESRGKIAAKGKGAIEMYFVEKRV